MWLTTVRIDRRQDLTSCYFQVIYVVSVYVNECSSFKTFLKYHHITDTFILLGGNVQSVFPSSYIDWVKHKNVIGVGFSFINNVYARVCIFVTLYLNSTRCQLINKIFFL